MITIEVNIDHGEVTPVGSQLFSEHGRGLLKILAEKNGHGNGAFSIGSEADGLPVIRGKGAVITSALVREIEEFAA